MALVHTPSSDSSKKCPEFSLPSIQGEVYKLSDFKEQILVFMFICNHCPYVMALENRILKLVNYFKDQDVGFIGICSNDSTTYPEDSIQNLKKRFKEKKYNFIYLHDETQKVARQFKAVCTPDFLIYNQDRKQVWRGRFDDHVESENKVQKQEMKEAIKNLLNNKKPDVENPSHGCSIKWNPHF